MSSSKPVLRLSQDKDVFGRVSRILARQHFPAFREFKIEVIDGAVTLIGRVSSFYEKQVAITSCQTVAGVVSLIDQIEVMEQ